MKVLFVALFAFLNFTLTASALPYSDVYIIGDSLSDQGNLFFATRQLTGQGIPADDHYFEGRFSNGKIYGDYLAEMLGLEIKPSSVGGTNFAYGGVRTDYNSVENDGTKPLPVRHGGSLPKGAFPWTLRLETKAFEERNITDSNALYIVFSGSNDVGDLIGPTLNRVIDPSKFIANSVKGIQETVQAFIDAGANDVLVPNIPDLGSVPLVFRQNPPGSTVVSDTATKLAKSYNAALDQMLNGFTGVNIIRFDTFSFVDKIIQNPENFGFDNATDPCYTGFVAPDDGTNTVCDSPEKYVFWDAEHPTTALHQLLADKMLKAIPEPRILLLFVIGVLPFAIYQKKS